MGLSQQEIDALKAERAQLVAQDAQNSGEVQNDLPAGQESGLDAQYSFPKTAAVPVPDSGGLPQIQIGDNVDRQVGQPAQAPAVAAAPLTPRQIEDLKAERAQLVAQDEGAPKSPEKKPDQRGMIQKAIEKIYPTTEEKDGGVINPELEKYPDWMTAPEVHDPTSPAAYKAILGNIASLGPDDVAGVLKEQFPDAKVERKGEYVTAQFKPGGPTYASKPGLRYSDFIRAGLGIPVMSAGAAAAAGALPAAVPAALSSLAGTGLGIHLLGVLRHDAGGSAPSLTEDAVGMGVHAALAPVTALAGKAIQSGYNAVRGIAPEAAGQMTAKQLAPEIVNASRGNRTAQNAVAAQVMPDQEALAAARSLPGVDGRPLADSITPAQLSTNKAFQELAQSSPGALRTHGRAISALGETMDKITKQAGAQESQAGVETALKNEAKSQLGAAKDLMEDLYAKLDGREAAAANPEKGIAAKPAVEPMVPGSAPTPADNFDAAVAKIAEGEKGIVPEWVQKVRDALDKPSKASGDLGPPTRDTVKRIKTLVGEATQGQGRFSKLGRTTAKTLYNALVADIEGGAESFSPGAKALSQEAKAAYLAHDAMDTMVKVTMGQELEKSLTDQMSKAVGELPNTDGKVFAGLIKATPEQMRPGVVKWALRQFVKENAEGGSILDIRKFNSWMNSMKNSPESWAALKSYAGDELSGNLEKTYKVSRSVETASKRFAPDFTSTFPDELPAGDKLKMGAKYALKAYVLDKMHIPDFIGYNILGSVFDPTTPLKSAVEDFLSSPAGRMAIENQLKGPVSEGFIRNLMDSGPAKRMLDAMRVPISERQQWWTRAFNTSAAGSPARPRASNDADLVKVGQ